MQPVLIEIFYKAHCIIVYNIYRAWCCVTMHMPKYKANLKYILVSKCGVLVGICGDVHVAHGGVCIYVRSVEIDTDHLNVASPS